jgi:hypothetical protein
VVVVHCTLGAAATLAATTLQPRDSRQNDSVLPAELEALTRRRYRELTIVVRVMVPPTQHHEICQVGTATMEPVTHVVRFETDHTRAAGVCAPAVTQQQCAELPIVHHALRPAQGQHVLGRGILDDRPDPPAAQQSFDDFRRQARAVLDVRVAPPRRATRSVMPWGSRRRLRLRRNRTSTIRTSSISRA